ncbi:hypothetical protein ES702_00165 [subsurface metagenome]
MRKIVIFWGVFFGLLLYLQATSMAQAPMMSEQLVYSLNVYNGKGYGGAFTPQTEDTIYLIANKNSAIFARTTLVYFWPITAKFMAGFQTLNEEVVGTLEILKEGKLLKSLKPRDNSLYYPEGYWGETSVLSIDEEARTYYEKYKKAIDEYYQKISEFYKARIEHRKKMDEFLEEIKKRREAGEEFTSEEIEKSIPKEPKPPEGPKFYTTEPRQDYIINLPVGTYRIRIRAEDGTIIQDSQKNLVVFTSRRTGGTGYEIIPGNRWTMREPCDDPARIIYAAGKNTLYFNPFTQDEYNELYYNKLEDPQNPGRVERWRWVHIAPIKDVTLLFLKGKEVLQRVKRLPYSVKQIPGATLGYDIIEYDQEKQPYEKPTFEGYKLDLSPTLENTGYQINLEKKTGGFFKGGKREVRLVRKENSRLLYALSIFPLVIGVVVFLKRRRRLFP